MFFKAVFALIGASIACDMVGFGVYGRYPDWKGTGAYWVAVGQCNLIFVIALCFCARIVNRK